MDLNLKDKTVLVTGASKGIGLAAAHAFAREGCHLHLAARSGAALADAAREIQDKFGVRVKVYEMDLSTSKAMIDLAERCNDTDILINNAGDIPAGTLDSLKDEDWRRGFELKVFGYITLARELYRHMK